MDIHKPKPIHNLREFLKEYAIIVIGVLTALAAEQAVEWLHWQSEVKAARVALADEFRTDDYFFARRVAVAPCMDRQLNEAEGIISDLLVRKAPRRFTTFHLGSGSILSDSEWQSDRAAQILTHFPRGELALMSRYYAMLSDFRIFNENEGAAWRELSILQDPPPGLELSLLMRLRVNLAAARSSERLIVLNSSRQLRVSEQLGHPHFAVDPERIKIFCTQKTEAYTRYVDTHNPTQ